MLLYGLACEFEATRGANLGVITRAGATYALAYDKGGGLTTVTDSTGRVMTFVPGGSGNVLSMTTPGGATYTYGSRGQGYDANGYATSTEHALERNKFTVSRVDYSTLTTVTDAFGTAHNYQS